MASTVTDGHRDQTRGYRRPRRLLEQSSRLLCCSRYGNNSKCHFKTVCWLDVDVRSATAYDANRPFLRNLKFSLGEMMHRIRELGVERFAGSRAEASKELAVTSPCQNRLNVRWVGENFRTNIVPTIDSDVCDIGLDFRCCTLEGNGNIGHRQVYLVIIHKFHKRANFSSSGQVAGDVPSKTRLL